MGRKEYLGMKTDPATAELINSDNNEPKIAAKNLINHATKLGGIGVGTSVFKWIAIFLSQIGGFPF